MNKETLYMILIFTMVLAGIVNFVASMTVVSKAHSCSAQIQYDVLDGNYTGEAFDKCVAEMESGVSYKITKLFEKLMGWW